MIGGRPPTVNRCTRSPCSWQPGLPARCCSLSANAENLLDVYRTRSRATRSFARPMPAGSPRWKRSRRRAACCFRRRTSTGSTPRSDSDGSVTFVQDVLDTTTPDPTDTVTVVRNSAQAQEFRRLAVPRAGHADVVPLGPVAAAQARRLAGRARGGQLPCIGTGPAGAGSRRPISMCSRPRTR